MDTGIASIGLAFPPLALPVEELAVLRGVNPRKYTVGLGCREIGLCEEGGVVELAIRAAERAVRRWHGDPANIGLVVVGTESGIDMSRPLSAWVADALDLRGTVRSYEVKHACFGGTAALRQALEWRLSGAARGRAALVVAADSCRYAEHDPAEPTQGAGAVAMVVADPAVAAVDTVSYSWSEPAFDFWRPIGDPYPHVDGPLSFACYVRAVTECFRQLLADADGQGRLSRCAALCFHTPFPKMVGKAVAALGREFGWSPDYERTLVERRVEPALEWNRHVGNAYTASLWIAVARALPLVGPGHTIAAFSYGSGYGSELLMIESGPLATRADWVEDVAQDMASRRILDAAGYAALRATRAGEGPVKA